MQMKSYSERRLIFSSKISSFAKILSIKQHSIFQLLLSCSYHYIFVKVVIIIIFVIIIIIIIIII